jgi:hypothetical protein
MTATALENHLDALECKMDELLAAFEGKETPQDLVTKDHGTTNGEDGHLKPERLNR